MVIREINGVIHVIDSEFYAVRPGSQVTLTVEVGDDQAGGTSYSWKGATHTGQPNFTDHPINPPGTSIGFSTLHCLTKVLDISPATNQTSVQYTLKGGVQDRPFPYGVQVAGENAMAVYQITFVFVETAA